MTDIKHISPVDEKKSLSHKKTPSSTRKRIGLALSSGNARSLAHIGVLQVLEEEGIPIDMIVGTSGGGLFGGLYAAGKSLTEIVTFARNLMKLYSIRSLTAFNLIPRAGLVRGVRVQKVLDEILSNQTFEEGRIPCGIIAADAITGEEVILRSGNIGTAIRATVSAAPLFEPVQLGTRWLFDGAAVNPLPISALEGETDIIIACSVIPSLQTCCTYHANNYPTRVPNLIDLAFNKEAIMEAYLIRHCLERAHVLIEPNVSPFGGFAFGRIDELIAAGREAAEKAMPKIKEIVER